MQGFARRERERESADLLGFYRPSPCIDTQGLLPQLDFASNPQVPIGRSSHSYLEKSSSSHSYLEKGAGLCIDTLQFRSRLLSSCAANFSLQFKFNRSFVTSMAAGKALPKFGAWDEQDPHSGDGFTVIFNAARDEKKTGGPANRLQPEAPPSTQPGDKPQNAEPHKFSLWGCCFRSSNAA